MFLEVVSGCLQVLTSCPEAIINCSPNRTLSRRALPDQGFVFSLKIKGLIRKWWFFSDSPIDFPGSVETILLLKVKGKLKNPISGS